MNVSLDDRSLSYTNISDDKDLVKELAVLLNVAGVLLEFASSKAGIWSVFGTCKSSILVTRYKLRYIQLRKP